MINLDLSKALLWGGGALGVITVLVASWLYVTGLRSEVARLESRVGQVTSEREEARRIAQANADAAEAIKADSNFGWSTAGQCRTKRPSNDRLIGCRYRDI